MILKVVPPELVTPLGSADDATTKKLEKLKTMRLDDEHIREARAQLLRREYEAIALRDGESVEELAVLGDTVEEKEVVKKYLRIMLEKYEQVAISIETLLDQKTISIEDIISRLMAAEDRISRRTGRVAAEGSLLLTHEEWMEWMKPQAEEGSSNGSGNGDKGHNKAPKKKGAKPPFGKD